MIEATLKRLIEHQQGWLEYALREIIAHSDIQRDLKGWIKVALMDCEYIRARSWLSKKNIPVIVLDLQSYETENALLHRNEVFVMSGHSFEYSLGRGSHEFFFYRDEEAQAFRKFIGEHNGR